MGMYTELILGCTLSEKTPELCIKALDLIINNEESEIAKADKDVKEFIEEYDLNYMLWGSSYYFGVSRSNQKFWHDKINGCYHISTRSNIKNYHFQIQKFLSYLKPYVKYGSGEHEIFAYVLYETDEFPTIYSKHGIYKIGDDSILKKVDN